MVYLLLGAVLLVLAVSGRARERAGGICSAVLDRTGRKSTNKEKALEFLRQNPGAGNEAVRARLGVSRQTAVRYMDELEKEGKVEQAGDSGRGVTYKIK